MWATRRRIGYTGCMPRYEPFDWYATPRYYDIIFDADTPREADFLDAVFDEHVTTTTRGRLKLLEPACGTGRLLKAMHDRGYACTGFDLEPGMVAYAHRNAPDARVFQAAMQDFTLPQALRGQLDGAFNLVSTFKYLPPDPDAATHLRLVADALKPGGVYALGLHLSEYGETAKNRERWVAQRDGTHVVCNIQGWPPDAATRTEHVRSRLIVTEQDTTRHYESEWDFYTYDEGQLQWLLAGEPRFELVTSYGYNETAALAHPQSIEGDQLDHVLVLRKRAE